MSSQNNPDTPEGSFQKDGPWTSEPFAEPTVAIMAD